ncbi:hypothetical protein JTB14_013101 [Gonioctena quinquepunctata]|nr:hypothetical protein JTB14_013101 [Gonioctena quinquepunctata]
MLGETFKKNKFLTLEAQDHLKRITGLPERVIKIWFKNRRLPHLNDLHLVIKEKKYDVIGLTETWLHPEIPDRALDIEGYRFIRSDRLVRRGGGTGVYIKNNLVYKVILEGTFDYLEQLWIEINLGKE